MQLGIKRSSLEVMATTCAAEAIQEHFGLGSKSKRAAWSDLMLNCGLSRVGLTVEEWQFFRRACSESGVVASAELATFRDMIRLMDRHGDDGHGDKPVDMSRVVYWFQHVAPVTRSRSRSPRR